MARADAQWDERAAVHTADTVIRHHPPHPSTGNGYLLTLLCLLYLYIIQYNQSNLIYVRGCMRKE